ncbi:peptide/nickel transport system substrate-binding protein [Shimia gijangensis]|uniref:Peptide/nickel transport system substrate-binding protein n=1 Tax=Shimia gijangensis TaxID=1470563 RepID=A0A1M6N409_9RHOB|nr:ABC transporter substrate-binding protein [Shimia gijangensis]SHJ90471.1 peptide/nickel transport system substrate-binding protein [Shimia gijangensis]
MTQSRFTKSGMLKRRDILKGSAALGVTGLLGAGLAPSFANASTPKKGGKFTVALGHGSTTDTLDPELNTGTGFHATLGFTIHNFLVETDYKGNAIPELAESWEASSDAKVWTFKIRKGVEFHDGRSVMPKDVLNSINIHRREDTKSSLKPVLSSITDVAIDGDNVVITLAGGNADLPYIMADFRLPILPAEGEGVDWKNGVGAGAYMLKDFDPGVSANCARNPNYWKSDRAHFDEVEILTIADQAARTNALVTGVVDAIDRVDLNTVDLMKRSGNVKVIETNGGTHYTLPMNATAAPFDDVNVRLALKYAVDRQAIVDTILSGYGSVANDQPLAPTHKYYNAELEQHTYDPDKAKFYLDKAGVSNLSVEIDVADAAYAGAVDTAVLFSEHAKAAGIDLKVNRHPNDGYWSKVWMQKSWSASYWGGQPTADLAMSQAFQSESSWNEGFWKNDKFDQLLVTARAELNEAKRKEMYGEMQRLISEEGSVIIPMFASNVYAISDGIQHGELEPRWALDTRRCAERWWHA